MSAHGAFKKLPSFLADVDLHRQPLLRSDSLDCAIVAIEPAIGVVIALLRISTSLNLHMIGAG